MNKMTPEEIDAFERKSPVEQLEEYVADAYKEGFFCGFKGGVVTGIIEGLLIGWGATYFDVWCFFHR